MDIKDFLTERQLKGEHLVCTRRWALEQAQRKFKEEYEEVYEYKELFENSGEEEWTLKEKYESIFDDMVDDFEDDILEYQSDLYD